MDIGTEEPSHLEGVGTLARMHLLQSLIVRLQNLTAIVRGGVIQLTGRQPWTADYLKITGELDGRPAQHIAAEARAKIVYVACSNTPSLPRHFESKWVIHCSKDDEKPITEDPAFKASTKLKK